MSSFAINQKQNEDAQNLASKLEDSRQRKRAYVDFLGAMVAVDYMQAKSFRVNTQRSVFNAPKLYLDFELVDIYCNSHVVYVITTYGTSIVRIPVKHKEYNIMPEAYMVIDIKAGMKEAEIKGVIFPEDFYTVTSDGRYYNFGFSKLRNIDLLSEKVKKYAGIKSSVGKHLDCMNLFIPYIDNKLDENAKKQLIAHILTCETCKKRLIEAIDFDNKSKGVENYNLVLSQNELKTKENFIKKIDNVKHEEEELKGAIDVIYDGAEYNTNRYNNTIKNNVFVSQYEKDPVIDIDVPPKAKKLAFVTFAIICLMVVTAIFAFNMPHNATGEDTTGKEVEGEVYNETAENPPDTSIPDYDTIIPKITKNRSYTTVSKVSWEVSSSVTNDEQKKFLQMAGKSIRLNLQNDLILSNEVAVNNRVKFNIKFMRDGNVEGVTISESSGTRAVDEVVRQSVENTLQYMHPPKGAFAGKRSPLTLVVNF